MAMRKSIYQFGGVLMGLLLGWSAAAVSGGPEVSAREVVKTTTDELLEQIVEKREVYREDTQLFFDEIQELLGSVVDFERIARRVMAKYYKQATVDQREKFIEVFKDSLLKIYAKGLLEFDNEEVIVLESNSSSANTKKQKVDIEVIDGNGKKYPISYSMYLDKTNNWRMENVIVNGINIGLTYRNQFSRLMQANRNDIDLVITDWTSEVNAN